MVEFGAAGRVVAGRMQDEPLPLAIDVDNADVRGTDGDDVLNGGDGNDTLVGGAGRDTLNGGAGNDVLFSGSEHVGYGYPWTIFYQANPTLDTGTETDTLDGGAGGDSIFAGYNDNVDGGVGGGDWLFLSLLGASTGVTMDFRQHSFSNGTGTIREFESIMWLQGSNFDDDFTLRATERGTVVYAMGGNDRVIADQYTSYIYGGDGDDYLDGRANQYTLQILDGGDGNDTLLHDRGGTVVNGGAGDDVILAPDSRGGSGNDTITIVDSYEYGDYTAGEDGDDLITGSTSNDLVSGGAGADVIRGGRGNDVLYSGHGLYLSNSGITDHADTGAERDQLFGDDGDDQISIGYGDDADGGTGTNILALNLQGATSGVTLDLANLTNGGAQVIGGGTIRNFQSIAIVWGSNFADTLTLASQSATNVVYGMGGDDTIIGTSSADRIDGGDGADYLDGRAGSDTMTGGAGDDTYVVDSANDVVNEDGGGGVDTVLSAITYTLGSLIENLTLTGSANIHGTGNLSDNILTGNSGSNHLNAAGGNDTLRGEAGDDILQGMDGDDTLFGGTGADILDGGNGADYLDGGTGADTMYGGAGSDTYVVDDIGDRAADVGPTGDIDTVLSSITYTLDSSLERLTLTGSAHINGTGHQFANLIIGNSGNNLLDGAGGNDTLRGEAGNDTLLGGDGDDVLDGGTGADQLSGGAGNDTFHVDRQDDLVFEDANGGTDTAIATGSYYLYANIENLTLAEGAGDLFGVGNDLANTILGNSGSNLLIAGAGDDTVRGGAGVDSLFGESGNDQLFGDAGIDYLVGGIGNDTLDGGTDADALYGEDGDDILIGGSGFHTDILVGGAGNDILRGDSGLGDYDRMDGGAGDDAYYVDTPDDLTFEAANGGTDTVYASITGAGYYLYANVENLVLGGNTPFGVGNELNNRITGSASANWLLGGAGDDMLNGGGGNDVLFGEAGADTFVFTRGTGADVVGDFTVGTDRIDLSAYGLTWQTVLNSMHENGGTTAIDLGNGDMIVLNGVARASLSQGDFILSAPTQDKVPVMEDIGRDLLADLMHDFHNPRLFVDVI